ncbi:MAG: ATP-dependent RNA helicase HrpA [Desulfobacteraceae bacterium]|nr:ATP-dependent RNA helicase HrpA [Desulfobacteraceae bacterium]
MTIRTIDILRRRLPGAMAAERARAGRELARLRRRAEAGEPLPEARLRAIGEDLRLSAMRKQERRARVPAPAYDPALPISAHRQVIVDAIRRHPVVIVAGETGSGKTTQLPKFCLEAGRGLDGMIGCTQPRRIAALTVARRIAEELGEEPGQTVGHKIRFHEKTSSRTLVKIMTDGILLAETQRDRDLLAYDTLIVDEAHERSLNIDFILGLLRRLLRRRRDLKLIVTSATIDTEKFAAAFDNAPVIEVSGRMFPVTIHYRPLDDTGDEDIASHVEAAVAAMDEIQHRGPFGDVLVFMPTEQDIRDTVELLEARRYRGAVILPLFARLSAADQMRVFAPATGRKIVVATNVAETSLTIPGIRYVVDTGLARVARHSPRTRTTALPVVPISRASCDQRAGRCGRVADGICFRLYRQTDYESRPRFTAPEILRTNLAEAVMRMISLNLGDIADFPFIDRPADKSIRDGIALLEELGAVAAVAESHTADARLGPRRLRLTPMGRRMARLPLDPRLSRMLIEARQRGCGPEMAVIAAALSINDVRERPADQSAAADQAHAAFVDRSSDFLTLLKIWQAYQEALVTEKTTARVRRWAKRRFLSAKRLREWRDIHDQLAAVMAELEADGKVGPAAPVPPDADRVHRGNLHQSILAGFLGNIAQRRDKNIYQATRGRQVMIFPGSGLFNRAGDWIVAAEIVETSRLFARTVATIDPAWLEAAGGDLCRYTYTHPRWERRRGEVVADAEVSLFGLVIASGRTVSYGPIDGAEASEIFIRSALVEGDLRQPLPFMVHNRALVDDALGLEDKIRRRDVLVSPEDLCQFYQQRLPEIYSLAALKRHLKQTGDAALRMTAEDVRRYCPDDAQLAEFPDELKISGKSFACTYRFAPDSHEDGVTVNIPAALAGTVAPESFDWLVPGLLAEKITALIRGLPKEYRRRLVPVAKTVEAILAEMPAANDEPLVTVLGRIVQRRFGLRIPVAAWPVHRLPAHLHARIAVTGPRGQLLAADRDPRVLQTVAAPADHRLLADLRRRWEREDVGVDDFPDLPESLSVDAAAGNWCVYPALVTAAGGRIDLRLLSSPAEARTAHCKAVGALYARWLRQDLRRLSRQLALPPAKRSLADCCGGATAQSEFLFETLARRYLERDIRSAAAFRAHAETIRREIYQTGQALLESAAVVIETVYETRQAIFQHEPPPGRSSVAAAFYTARRQELAELVPPDFMVRYDPAHLEHLPRYIRALGLRVTRAAVDLEKDRRKAEAATPFEQRLARWRQELAAGGSSAKSRRVDEFFWLLEEFKVSLFAQELGTAVPVSAKRLEKLANEIEAMG